MSTEVKKTKKAANLSRPFYYFDFVTFKFLARAEYPDETVTTQTKMLDGFLGLYHLYQPLLRHPHSIQFGRFRFQPFHQRRAL